MPRRSAMSGCHYGERAQRVCGNLSGTGFGVPAREFPLECPSSGADWYARKEGGHLGTLRNVWVSTPGRVFKRVLREWGHGCQVC